MSICVSSEKQVCATAKTFGSGALLSTAAAIADADTVATRDSAKNNRALIVKKKKKNVASMTNC